MEQETGFDDECEVEEVPVSPRLSVKRPNPYGSVPGLDDEELADPQELERQVFLQEWGPVLALPVRGRRSGIQPVVDESGGLDWGAFGTVDFERTMPEFDRAQYKADRLREERANVLIMLSVIIERVPGRAKYQVLKHLRLGIIGLEHIANEDMQAVARVYLRALRLQRQIAELREASLAGRRRRLAPVLA